MSDLKLFRISSEGAVEQPGSSALVDRRLQDLMEANLEALLGVRFLASEHPTGSAHIDTLALDANRCPVVVVYRRSAGENVISKGVFHLDWLLEHRAEFALLCRKVLGPDHEEDVNWGGRRLICVAGGFSRYDGYAAAQMSRDIELVRYRRYGDDFLVLQLVSTTGEDPAPPPGQGRPPDPAGATARGAPVRTLRELLDQSPENLRQLYRAFHDLALSLGPDATRQELKLYVVFRRVKNFACLEVHPRAQKLVVYVKVNPDEVELIPGFTRNVRRISHLGTGDLEITLTNLDDLRRAKPLLLASYEAS